MLLADTTNYSFLSISRGQDKVIVHFGQKVKYFELILIYDLLSPEERVNEFLWTKSFSYLLTILIYKDTSSFMVSCQIYQLALMIHFS